MNRRNFLKQAAAAVAIGSVSGASLGHARPQKLRITHHRLDHRLSFPLRIAQLTDLHLGWRSRSRLLEDALAACKRAKPDVVVLTGDYVNHSLKYLDKVENFIGLLPKPCVTVLGNHDHWSGAEPVKACIQRAGGMVLRNQALRLKRGTRVVTFVGVDDGHTGHDDVKAAFKGISDPQRTIVLTHAPTTARRIEKTGARLVLAGHTHGGQFDIPSVTRGIARLAGQPYLSGWYQVGAASLYVNVGIGSSAFGRRLGKRAHPELAFFDLG
jgi:uncharacterized protein